MRTYPPHLADHLAVGLVAWVVPAAGDAAVSSPGLPLTPPWPYRCARRDDSEDHDHPAV